MQLKDSGERRKFETGAARDIADGKGRCDLLPLAQIALFFDSNILLYIDSYIRCGTTESLLRAVEEFSIEIFGNLPTAMLEVSKHYEDGAKKYSERNWEKGIPVHCYIDSGVRHYLKFLREDKDEPHDRAFLWNMLGAVWTHKNKPEMIDLPFIQSEVQNE